MINWGLIGNPYNWGVVLIVMLFVAMGGIFIADKLKQGS